MGNKSSSPSDSNMDLKEPHHHHHHHVVPNRRIFSSRPKGDQTEQPHGKKPLGNDEAFSTYIKDSKFKMKSKSNIGGHEDHSNAVPVDVADEYNYDRNKENEKDHFSDFIANARKKLRTVTRRNSSIRRG